MIVECANSEWVGFQDWKLPDSERLWGWPGVSRAKAKK